MLLSAVVVCTMEGSSMVERERERERGEREREWCASVWCEERECVWVLLCCVEDAVDQVVGPDSNRL